MYSIRQNPFLDFKCFSYFDQNELFNTDLVY